MVNLLDLRAERRHCHNRTLAGIAVNLPQAVTLHEFLQGVVRKLVNRNPGILMKHGQGQPSHFRYLFKSLAYNYNRSWLFVMRPADPGEQFEKLLFTIHVSEKTFAFFFPRYQQRGHNPSPQ